MEVWIFIFSFRAVTFWPLIFSASYAEKPNLARSRHIPWQQMGSTWPAESPLR